MIHQRIKDIIFYGICLYSLVGYPFLKFKFRNSKELSLHVGSGRHKLRGFLNIDGNPFAAKDSIFDIRLKLPFEDGSAKIIYTSNTLEHFYVDELLHILGEFRRVLGVGGMLRIVVPDLEKSINAYTNRDHDFFLDFPRSFDSIGGRFVNFMFCDSQHKIAFDFEFIRELLGDAGFIEDNVRRVSFGESNIEESYFNEIKSIEGEYRENNLFVEAIK